MKSAKHDWWIKGGFISITRDFCVVFFKVWVKGRGIEKITKIIISPPNSSHLIFSHTINPSPFHKLPRFERYTHRLEIKLGNILLVPRLIPSKQEEFNFEDENCVREKSVKTWKDKTMIRKETKSSYFLHFCCKRPERNKIFTFSSFHSKNIRFRPQK